MSLKMFFLSAFGGIKDTAKYEAQQEQLEKDYLEFIAVKDSDELKQFLELENQVSSAAFLNLKTELKNLKFKGSPEEKQLKEYNKLHNNKKLKKYYLTLGSSNLKKFNSLKDSDGLKRYEELKSFVESGSYKTEKDKYKKEVFKGSEECKKIKELKKLEKNKRLKNYFHVEKNPSLKEDEKFKKGKVYKDYQEISQGNILNHFKNLQEEVNSKEFKDHVEYLKDAKKFEKTEAFNKYEEYKKLKVSEDIRFYHKYPRSSDYKNYLTIDSSELKIRYEAVKEIVESDKFSERKAYLEDDKKWEKTDEYQKEQLFLEMKVRPHLVKYFSYVDTDKLNFFKKWEVVFEDRFDEHRLDEKKWQTLSPWAESSVGKNFSTAGDLHGFTDGANVKMDHGNLQILVKKEKIEALVWRMPMGFHNEDLEYSSGLISSVNKFQAEYGILEAKVKYKPRKELVDVIYLGGETQASRLNLLETGAVNRVGVTGETNAVDTLKGLVSNKYYIFRMEWEKDRVCWSINGNQVFELKSNIPTGSMHINFASLVIKDTTSLPHQFTTDWVRFYQKKA